MPITASRAQIGDVLSEGKTAEDHLEADAGACSLAKHSSGNGM